MMPDKKVVHVSAWAKLFTQFKMPQVLRHKEEFGRVVLYCPDDPAHVERLKRAGFEVRLSPMSKTWDYRVPGQIFRLYRYLKKERFDMLFAHQAMGGLVGVLAARLAGTPLVIYACAGIKYQPDRKGLFNWLMKVGEFKVSEWSDAVFVNNRDDEALLKAQPRIRDKVWYVGPRGGCGVDTGAFNDAGRIAGRAAARAELGAGGDTVAVGYVGRCVWEKGFRELVDAAAELKRERPGLAIRYFIVGEGADTEDIARYAAEKGVDDRMEFLGYRFNVEHYMSAMDVFVLPSHREGLPVALMQALAMGLPCIATDIKGCHELIEHGVTGLLIPAGDAGALAGALRRMVDDPGAGEAMGSAASKHVAANYGEKVLVDNLTEITRTLVARYGG